MKKPGRSPAARQRKPKPATLVLLQQAAQLHEAGQLFPAAAYYRQAIETQPELAGAHYNLANLLQQQGDFEEAAASYRRALELEPELREAWGNLGSALKDLKRPDEAIAAYHRALELGPDDGLINFNLGNLLKDQRRFEEAAERYKQAIALQPRFDDAYANLVHVYGSLDRMQDQAEWMRAWLAFRPERSSEHFSLGYVLFDQCKAQEAFDAFGRATQLRPDDTALHSVQLCISGYCVLHTPGEYLELARRWDAAAVPAPERAAAAARRLRRPPLAGRRLRVGYVSGDLRQHSVSYFIDKLASAHDRSRVELFGYPTFDQKDQVTERIATRFDHWIPLHGLPDAAARDRIDADGVDVLVDLSGHTAHNRLGVFARRAAPVQAHYLGYFASTGLAQMDYWIGDEILTPAADDGQFSERVWRLPRVWVSYEGKPEAPATRWQPAADGSILLGSFNDLKKFTPATAALWARVLKALPQARLLMKAGQLRDAGNRQHVLQSFAAHGVEAGRVELLDYSASPDWPAHMAMYDRLDIALDPVGAVGGGTTTCDALWMGVPVVGLSGDRAASRMTASMLHAIGRKEWLAATEDDYVAIAAALARDVEGRRQMRGAQRERVAQSPLCDARGLARQLEDAYAGMVERRLAAAP
jgi:predicted O-linked N-acetylglucosamine transferase (SPINDLY family)